MKNFYCLLAGILCTPMILCGQNVGIGTLTPARKLEVKDTQSPYVARFTSTLPQSAIRFGTDSIDFVEMGHLQGEAYINTLTNSDLNLRINGYTTMKLQASTGRVGIGNLTPSAMLHVEGFLEPEVGYFINYGDLARVRVSNYQTQTELGANLNVGFVGTTDEKDFAIRSNGLSRMTFKGNNGYVGIGTTTPAELFHVYSPNGFTDLAKFESYGGYGQVLVSNGTITSDLGADDTKGYVGTNSDHDFSIRAGGDDVIRLQNGTGFVGIGTSSPWTPLHVKSYLNCPAIFEGTGVVSFIKVLKGNSQVDLWTAPEGSGIGVSSSNYFSITSDGFNRLVMNCSNGNVGIGQLEPNMPLTIQASPTQNVLQFRNSSGTNKWHWWMPGGNLCLTESGVADNRLYIQANTGNVGLGINNPDSPLHILAAANRIAKFEGTGTSSYITVQKGTKSMDVGANDNGAYLQCATGADFSMLFGNSAVMTMKANTNYLGLGTTTPAAPFHIVSPNQQIVKLEGTGPNTYFTLKNANAFMDVALNPQSGSLSVTGGANFFIATGGYTRIMVDNSGNVGIGYATPNMPLSIQSDINANTIQLKNYAGTNKWNWSLPGDNLNLAESGVADNRLYIQKTTGNVGIGTNNPTAKLEVNGSAKFNGAVTVTSLEVEPVTTVTSFYIPQFYNLGAPYENVNYYKDKEGVVHLSGVVGITGSQSGTIFILPSGYHPAGDQVFACMTSGGNAWRINVNLTGNVTISGNLSGWVSLSGISFRAN